MEHNMENEIETREFLGNIMSVYVSGYIGVIQG